MAARCRTSTTAVCLGTRGADRTTSRLAFHLSYSARNWSAEDTAATSACGGARQGCRDDEGGKRERHRWEAGAGAGGLAAHLHGARAEQGGHDRGDVTKEDRGDVSKYDGGDVSKDDIGNVSKNDDITVKTGNVDKKGDSEKWTFINKI